MKFLKGFTLVEVLIVVVILGILAAAVLPRMTGQVDKARTAEAVNIMSAMRHALSSYFDEHLAFPNFVVTSANMEATLGITHQASQHGWTFTTLTASSGVGGAVNDLCTITATMNNNALNTITLNVVTGAWGGTGDYAPGVGRFWPYLQQFLWMDMGSK